MRKKLLKMAQKRAKNIKILVTREYVALAYFFRSYDNKGGKK